MLTVNPHQETEHQAAQSKWALEYAKMSVPVICSGTVFMGGVTLTGQSLEAFLTAVEHFPLFAVGLNCSLGPKEMRGFIETVAEQSRCYVSCYPNAGMPDGMGGFNSNPTEFAAAIRDFAQQGWLNIVGGCCGTTPEFIKLVGEAVEGVKPHEPSDPPHYSRYSGAKLCEVRPDSNFLMIGERTNVTGSRKFARLIREKKYDEYIIGSKKSEVGIRRSKRREEVIIR